MSNANLPLIVQTSMSAGWQACVDTEVGAGILRAVLSAAASWDTKSTTEKSRSTLTETELPAKVLVLVKRNLVLMGEET